MQQEEYFLTFVEARMLLQVAQEAQIELSLDLGLGTTVVTTTPEKLVLPSGLEVPREELEEIARKKNRVFSLRPGGAEPVEIVGEHYYKLAPTVGAPTLEIDGVQMHRTSTVEPFEDSRLKVEGTVLEGDVVLDTCGGLGYTAIWSVRLGAQRVVSVEVCPEVRELRGRNPWSEELFKAPIELVDADIFEYARELESETFDSVIHDPPRFSLAGELYGAKFYAQLRRVLKPGGRLFHYTGAPYSRRGMRDFPAEVTKRLAGEGFRARQEPDKLGVSARKLAAPPAL
jgi:predicted methyltransferase